MWWDKEEEIQWKCEEDSLLNLTAAELGLSVEDNAGTGGGGGSFVYTTSNVLLLAAGGGGGASSGYNGTDGQSGTNGTSSVGRFSSQVFVAEDLEETLVNVTMQGLVTMGEWVRDG